MNVYFSDYFGVPSSALDSFGAFNISLINDLPVFIDPFLLFHSDKPEYQALHQQIIRYIRFLRDMSDAGTISGGLVRHWFRFPEVKQNWLGYSKVGNSGSGLGQQFASALNENLATIFQDLGNEQITRSSHLEKLCLIKEGVGRDNISDFTTNLIKGFLAEYTAEFAQKHLKPGQTKLVSVTHAEFNYSTRRWHSKRYQLPYIDGDYVLLTPKDILTKDEAWINKHDIFADFDDIMEAIPSEELRAQVNDYLLRQLPTEPNRKDLNAGIAKTFRKYPELVDRYIRYKEDHGSEATTLSQQKVRETEAVFISNVSMLIDRLKSGGDFFSTGHSTLDEAYQRVLFLKQVIENNDG